MACQALDRDQRHGTRTPRGRRSEPKGNGDDDRLGLHPHQHISDHQERDDDRREPDGFDVVDGSDAAAHDGDWTLEMDSAQ
jgi:hypothetical protein